MAELIQLSDVLDEVVTKSALKQLSGHMPGSAILCVHSSTSLL